MPGQRTLVLLALAAAIAAGCVHRREDLDAERRKVEQLSALLRLDALEERADEGHSFGAKWTGADWSGRPASHWHLRHRSREVRSSGTGLEWTGASQKGGTEVALDAAA